VALLLNGFILDVVGEKGFSGGKSQKSNAHAALFDQMKKVLRHFLGPHDAGYQFNLVLVDLEFHQDLGIGWTDIGSLDEHAGQGDILGKSHPISVIHAEAYRKAFLLPFDVSFVYNSHQ
jgi:hypothetical protein